MFYGSKGLKGEERRRGKREGSIAILPLPAAALKLALNVVGRKKENNQREQMRCRRYDSKLTPTCRAGMPDRGAHIGRGRCHAAGSCNSQQALRARKTTIDTKNPSRRRSHYLLAYVALTFKTILLPP